MTMRIGFIGLGVMGRPMAGHLLKAGRTVTGYDVSDKALDSLVEAGGRKATSIAGLVEASDVVITMVPAAAQAREVYLGAGGVMETANPSHILVDCSTLGVDPVLELHGLARAKGLRFLDAPVTGASPGAINGTLVFIAGGDKATVDEVAPVLLEMGSKCIHAGPGGSGQAIKVCNNMATGTIKAAICEAFVLVEKLGIDPKIYFEVASQGSAQSFALNVLCPYPGLLPNAPSSRGYQGGFATRLMHKDLQLATEAAAKVGAAIPVTQRAAEMFGECARDGFADLDNGVLFKYLMGLPADKHPAAGSDQGLLTHPTPAR